MNRAQKLLPAVALGLLLSGAGPSLAQGETNHVGAGEYIATLVDTQHVRFSSTVPLRLHLDRLTTDDEAAALGRAARKGPAAFREVFFGNYIGRVDLNSRLGDPILYARRFNDEDGAHLIAIAQRFVSTGEHFANSRTVDYPFAVIQLDVRPDGTTSGSYYLAARVEPHRDGTVTYTSLAFAPERLMAVQRID